MRSDYRDKVHEKLAWADNTHANVFDYMHKMPDFILKSHYESFNEGKLFNQYKNEIKGKKLFEIGCATGEFYRYISKYCKDFEYWGFDISEPAIKRAKEKYPYANFFKITNTFNEIANNYGRPDVVWCRDVVLHQEKPYEFLENLIDLTNEILILRLRTRDKGDTESDSNISCQLHWDKYWVPYIVLNINELIEKISGHDDINKVVISRSYEVLGGHTNRYLPKDLYFSNTGTSETAIYIQKEQGNNKYVEVIFNDQQDREKLTIFNRIVRKIASIVN